MFSLSDNNQADVVEALTATSRCFPACHTSSPRLDPQAPEQRKFSGMFSRVFACHSHFFLQLLCIRLMVLRLLISIM